MEPVPGIQILVSVTPNSHSPKKNPAEALDVKKILLEKSHPAPPSTFLMVRLSKVQEEILRFCVLFKVPTEENPV